MLAFCRMAEKFENEFTRYNKKTKKRGRNNIAAVRANVADNLNKSVNRCSPDVKEILLG